MPNFTLWFTGLSGSGKSTNSYRVYMELKRRSLKAELLDGDIIRINFSQGLGFSKRDRDINIRRIGFVSYLLNKNDIISIVAILKRQVHISRSFRQAAAAELKKRVYGENPPDAREVQSLRTYVRRRQNF